MTASSTIRWHRHEQRKRKGRVLVEIEADEIGLELLLHCHGLLSSCGAKDHSELVTAFEQLVERLITANALGRTSG